MEWNISKNSDLGSFVSHYQESNLKIRLYLVKAYPISVKYFEAFVIRLNRNNNYLGHLPISDFSVILPHFRTVVLVPMV